ncbi:MAG: type II secretion system secretin GspD [Pseudomonadota bacterium]
MTNTLNPRAAHALLALLAWLASLTGMSVALAQDGMITPNYREADIRQVIDAVQAVTGKNMIIDQRVNAKVTLLSSEPMTPEEFYSTFLSVLAVNNFQAVESGNVIKIIPSANVRQEPANLGNKLPEEVLTTVIRLENIAAAQLVPILRPLLPGQAHLAAQQTSNALIISDTRRNVDRIRYLIRQIDRPVEADVEVIPLANASATDIVTTLTALNNANRAEVAGTANALTLVADARTNSVLVSGVAASRLKARTLIAHLDTPQEAGGDTQVRYLKYARAEDLASKLQTLDEANAEGQPPNQTDVNIWADEQTNALIISAPQATMRKMMSVIDKLDIRRAQVLVEALIVEITIDRDSQFGTTWAVDGSGDNNAIGVTDFASSNARIAGLAAGVDGGDAAAIASAIGEGITLGVGRISDSGTSFAAILSALQGEANTNVVSTPTLMTLDNEEAKIEIGQEVPFITGQFSNTGGNNNGAVNPFQTVNREKIGTLLEITPQINEGDAILLKIKQEISSLSASAGAVDLITNERLIETSVIVQDGGILVLGGLIEDNLTESDQRVPVLGKIPLLGNLFRSRTTEKTKTNLMVFIRPRIVRDNLDSLRETNVKYNYLRDLQLGNGKPVSLMRDAERPTLEPFDDMIDEEARIPPPQNIMQEQDNSQ